MGFSEAISGAREAMTVKRVYGEPYERNGVMVIPAAEVMGAAAEAAETSPRAAPAVEVA